MLDNSISFPLTYLFHRLQVAVVIAFCLVACLFDIHAAPFETIRIGGNPTTSKVTVVSGHWVLPSKGSKHPIHLYHKWWKNSLSIKAHLLFFTDDQEVVRMIQDIRGDMPTVIKYRNLTTDMMSRFPDFKSSWVIAKDVPSKEIGVIWLDKIFMIQEAIAENFYDSDWYCWNDAGNAYYRDKRIRSSKWPSSQALTTLPADKFIYSSSWYPLTEHSVAGTAFMFHKDIMKQLTLNFWATYHACSDKNCGSDQILFSRMKSTHPEFFYQVGYGYGVMIEKMFLIRPPHTSIHNRSDVCNKDNGVMADIFQIMKNTEKKDPTGMFGFKGLCKSLWKTTYPTWKLDYANFLKEKQREREAKASRQRFKKGVNGGGRLEMNTRLP